MLRKLIYSLITIFIGANLVFFLYHLAYNHKIYPWVKLGKTDISNLTIDEAEKILSQISETMPKKIELRFGNQNWPVDLDGLKIRYNPRSTAEKAYLRGRDQGIINNFKTKLNQWFRPAEIEMETKINEERLEELVEIIAKAINEDPIFPALNLNQKKEVELMVGKNGRLVETENLKQKIIKQIKSLSFEPIEIPVKLVEVNISGDELVRAKEKADQIKNKRLKLNYQEFTKVIEGQELINLIGFKEEWDEEKIASMAANLSLSLNREAQNAVFQFDGQKVIEFKPALPGLKVNETEIIQLIKNGLSQLENYKLEEFEVKIKVEEIEPKIKTSEVNNLGIKELIGKGESYFYHSIPGRIHNLALTAAKLNGVLIPPGEVFSFNQTVGDISAATGYQQAYIIKEGRTVLGDGGGVCQDSTTLFRAVLDAGLEILERKAHAYRVSYYENNSQPGFDATVYNPTDDFKFKNDTDHHILIQTTVDIPKSYLKFELYGTKDGRKAIINNIRLWDQTPPPAPLYQEDPTLPAGTVKQIDWAAWGAKAAFDWTVIKNGEVLHQKTWYSNYRPWQAVYLKGTRP